MKNGLLSVLAVVALATSANSADACWWGWCAPQPWTVTYQQVVVTCYYAQWQPERVACVVPRLTYREEVFAVPTVTYRAEWTQQTRKVVYYVPEPKVVDRDVVMNQYLPVTAGSPITGCFINYVPRPVIQRVQAVAYDYRPEVRDLTTNVCRMVPEVRVEQRRTYVPEVKYEPSWTVRYHCVMVPYQQVVNVPVCVPCGPWCW